MARRRRTGTTRQRWDCLAAARRFSGVKIFLEVSGKRVAIFVCWWSCDCEEEELVSSVSERVNRVWVCGILDAE